MPRRRITAETVTKLLESYRALPGNANRAAQAAAVDWRTARAAWTRGWPGRSFGEAYDGRPMCQIIGEEQQIARARRAEIDTDTAKRAAELEAQRRIDVREKAEQDATTTRTEEARVVSLARSAALQLLGTINGLAGGAGKLGGHVAAYLDQLANRPEPMTTGEAFAIVKLMKVIIDATKQAVEAGGRAMELERLLLGEPQQIVAFKHESMTLDEAAARIDRAKAMLDRARARGIVLDGDAAGAAVKAKTDDTVH